MGFAASITCQNCELATRKPWVRGSLVILSDDIFKIDPVKIRDVKVLKTIVGGKIVYEWH